MNRIAYPYPRRITEQAKRADALIGELTRSNGPQTAATYERALDKQAEEITTLKEQISYLTQWRDIQTDADGFASDDALDDRFRNLPRLVQDKRDGS